MTQERLLDIAIREFGFKGLEGASTRGIATAAGTAMSSITYHYGGKDGLYLAAADHIAAVMAEEMAPLLTACAAPGDPAAARAGIHAIMDSFVAKMASEASSNWALFILREQLNPTEAFERIYAGMMGEMLRCIAELIAVATGRNARVARVAAVSVFAQGVAIRSARASIVRLLEIETLDPANAGDIRERIHTNIDAILDRMIAENSQ